jgi:plasmid stabilization system protein ParE
MTCTVRFSPEAEQQITSLFEYIATEASSRIAARYVESILTFCGQLKTFPLRGSPRDDIRSGIRTISYKKRALIAYTVEDNQVIILGVYYGGQDYESLIRDHRSR